MFACIFIPDFPVEAILRFEPELRPRPVAVLTGRPPLEKVFALNEKARQAGVEVGATRAQLEAWSELALRTRSPSQEESAQAALLDCAQSFSPEVEATAPDTLLLNLAGLEPLFGPLSKIARDIAHRVSKLELEANVAVASNPDAALLAARGFPGVTLIPEGHESERLRDLPVAVLLESFVCDAQEAEQLLQTLDRWGISKLRELAALPEVPLSERLGQQGIHLQKLARGAVSRHLRLYESPPTFAESVELEHPIVLLEPLAFLLNRMLEQVCARLGSRALAAQELRLELELEPCSQGQTQIHTADCDTQRVWGGHSCPPTFTRTLRLPVPMLDVKTFLKLLQLDLQAHPPGAPIVKIRLSAEPARPRATQSGLFLPPVPEPEKLELTLARIAGIVGQGRVGSVALLDTHREDAFEMRHFAPMELEMKKPARRRKDVSMPDNGNARPSADHAEAKTSAVIALRLFRPPLRAAITLREGKPVRLECPRDGLVGEIVWTAGPWRSSGDWYEQEGWSREEWDIAMPAESGLMLYRLVQDKLNGKWFVEGVYD
jgi:protein ImuB